MRSIDYGGEEHPATAKRTVVVAVSRLPLKNDQARHVVKLLAGPRWSPHPPSDSGIGSNEGCGTDSYIKISCEDFPQPGMNLKWISDALDTLIDKANVRSLHMVPEYFLSDCFRLRVADLLAFLLICGISKRKRRRATILVHTVPP